MTDARRAQLLTVLGTALAVLAGLLRGIEVRLLWQLLVLGVAAGGGQVQGGIDHDDVGRVEVAGEPVGLDDPRRGKRRVKMEARRC